jgi:TolA-binding protein
MESTVGHVTHPAWWLQLYAWADARKQQLLYGSVGVVVVGIAVSYFLYHRSQREVEAGEALSQASTVARSSGARAEKPEPFLKVASDFSGTSAAGQAILRAATAHFVDGKYPEAQGLYDRFIREYRDNPLVGQAQFGVAASLDAQGKAADAIERYKSLIERRPNDNMIPQARLNLARNYEGQNKPEQAKSLYEEVARTSPYGAAGAEAGARLQALLAKFPKLAVVPEPGTNAPAIKPVTP